MPSPLRAVTLPEGRWSPLNTTITPKVFFWKTQNKNQWALVLLIVERECHGLNLEWKSKKAENYYTQHQTARIPTSRIFKPRKSKKPALLYETNCGTCCNWLQNRHALPVATDWRTWSESLNWRWHRRHDCREGEKIYKRAGALFSEYLSAPIVFDRFDEL